jgi:hypothetical protein
MNAKDEEFFSKLMLKCQAENWNSIPADKLIGTIVYSMQSTKKTAINKAKFFIDLGLLQAGVSGYLITEEAKKKYWVVK